MKLFRVALVDNTVTKNPIISFPYLYEVCLIIIPGLSLRFRVAG